ncbi:hypothetical protein SRHO_G00065440 [Serrasalmus rhombeus]
MDGWTYGDKHARDLSLFSALITREDASQSQSDVTMWSRLHWEQILPERWAGGQLRWANGGSAQRSAVSTVTK